MTKAAHLTAQLIFGAALLTTSLGVTRAMSAPASAAEAGPANCTLTVSGKSYINEMCEFQPDGKNGSFSIYGERHWAMVSIEHGKAEASWNGVGDPQNADGTLGTVHRAGGCWENAKARICVQPIEQARRDAILAARPKGLMLSPDLMENLCASAPGYKFEPGAALVMERCDQFLGLRQRVFKRTGDNISFEGKPGLCVDARPSADGKETQLVLDDCAHVAIRWSYDKTMNVIRSGNNLCWDVRFSDDKKDGDTPSPMIARPCENDAEKNGRFAFRDGLGDGD